MTKQPWSVIEPLLNKLRTDAAALKTEFPDEADFTPQFAELAEPIMAAANDECFHDACIRATDILIDSAYVPRSTASTDSA